MAEYFVSDLRTNEDPSMNIVPRLSTYEELQEYFGIEVETQFGWAATPIGKACWKVAGFELRTGVAAYLNRVHDVSGNPMSDILMVNWWPGVSKYDQSINPHYRKSENSKWDGGFTNGEGVHGHPYGGGSIGGPQGGPDVVWVSASPPGQEPQFSDAVSGLGWIGGTDHLCPNVIFQYTLKDDDPGPGPGPNPPGDYIFHLYVNGSFVGVIPVLDPSTPLDTYLKLLKGELELGRVPIE